MSNDPFRKEDVNFNSDGVSLAGSFYYPADSDQTRDVLVMVCSGFQGLKNIHPERFARFLVQDGYTCFGFDYKGFGKSEGDRTDTTIESQVSDIQNALKFVKENSSLKKVVLMGWGMAGGMVFEVALNRPEELVGIVTANGFFNGQRVQEAVRGQEAWTKFQKFYEEQDKGSDQTYDPFDIYPLDEVTRGYVDGVLFKNPDFGSDVKMAFAESLLSFAPDVSSPKLADLPLFIIHGDNNQLHPVQEAQILHETYQGPKEIYWVPQAGHTEWMLDDNPKFLGVVANLKDWLNTEIQS